MSGWIDDPVVAVVRETPAYARTAPYPPSESFPEWPGLARGSEENPAYRAVRLALSRMGLDAARFGTPAWNPLEALVRPGGRVVIKPNFVAHRNRRPSAADDTDCLVTHGSFVRAVLDYAARALGTSGEVLVCDAPVQGTRWPELSRLVGLDAVLADARRRFPGVRFEARDHRLTHAALAGERVRSRRTIEPAPDAYEELDLRGESMLVPLMDRPCAFGVAQYPRRRMSRTHSPESNRYLVPREVLTADLVINLPKMKCHQKAGITCALKNLVGVNGHKDYLPHFRFGSPRTGGDEYPDGGAVWDLYWSLIHAEWELDGGPRKALLQAGAAGLGQLMRRVLRVPRTAFARAGGSWHGNDTLWRTVLDINRAFLYYDRAERAIGSTASRSYLVLLDGLVGGQRESPLAPSPVAAGLVLAARNPLALDTVAAALMGFDWRRIPQLARGWELTRMPLARFGCADVVIRGWPGVERVDEVHERAHAVPFEPSCGWKGHVEAFPGEPARANRTELAG